MSREGKKKPVTIYTDISCSMVEVRVSGEYTVYTAGE